MKTKYIIYRIVMFIVIFIGMLFFISQRYKSYRTLKKSYENEVLTLTSIISFELYRTNMTLYSDKECKLFEQGINDLYRKHFGNQNKTKLYHVYLNKNDSIIYIYQLEGKKQVYPLSNIPFNTKVGDVYKLKESFFISYLFHFNYNMILATISPPLSEVKN